MDKLDRIKNIWREPGVVALQAPDVSWLIAQAEECERWKERLGEHGDESLDRLLAGKDARIAELGAEVARLRAALWVSDDLLENGIYD